MIYPCAALLILLLLLFFIGWHRLRLGKERGRILPNGKMVQVNGANMHVYAQGTAEQGAPRIVVLSGSSMPSPVYGYKKLYDKFSTAYRVVVPEKFGYGYSDVIDSPRDVETILEQTREALRLADELPPYILMPHSMSGIEAQLWALKYPQEISAIIGLDMALPYHYEKMNLRLATKCYKACSVFMRQLGIQRLAIFQKAVGVFDKDALTESEWQQEQYLIHAMAFNKLIYEESVTILESARLVDRLGIPDKPMLLLFLTEK